MRLWPEHVRPLRLNGGGRAPGRDAHGLEVNLKKKLKFRNRTSRQTQAGIGHSAPVHTLTLDEVRGCMWRRTKPQSSGV